MSHVYNSHHESIDWSNPTNRRIILANLLAWTSSLECKHQGIDTEKETPRSKLIMSEFQYMPLEDKYDNGSYYHGAIFKNKNFNYQKNSRNNPPEYIIAFRGTLLSAKTFKHDTILDLDIVSHRLHKCSLVKKAVATVFDKVNKLAGGRAEHVWLAGHSLGAFISLAVGRKLFLEHNLSLETFLFNPPFVSSYSNEGLRILTHYLKTAIAPLSAVKVHPTGAPQEACCEQFKKLSSWIPHLFVNEFDPICNGYINYFQRRGTMEDIATPQSFISVIGGAFGKDWEPTHLIPCANLTITSSSGLMELEAHDVSKEWLKLEAHKVKELLQLEPHRVKTWLNHDLKFHTISYRLN